MKWGVSKKAAVTEGSKLLALGRSADTLAIMTQKSKSSMICKFWSGILIFLFTGMGNEFQCFCWNFYLPKQL